MAATAGLSVFAQKAEIPSTGGLFGNNLQPPVPVAQGASGRPPPVFTNMGLSKESLDAPTLELKRTGESISTPTPNLG